MIEGGSHNNNNNFDNQATEENNNKNNNNKNNTQDPNEIPAINITYNNKSYQPDDEETEQIAVEPNPDYALPTNTTLPKNQNKMDDPIQTSEPITTQNNNNDPVTPTISPEKPAVERKQSSSILKKQGSEKNGNSRSINKKATFENSKIDDDQQDQKEKEIKVEENSNVAENSQIKVVSTSKTQIGEANDRRQNDEKDLIKQIEILGGVEIGKFSKSNSFFK